MDERHWNEDSLHGPTGKPRKSLQHLYEGIVEDLISDYRMTPALLDLMGQTTPSPHT